MIVNTIPTRIEEMIRDECEMLESEGFAQTKTGAESA